MNEALMIKRGRDRYRRRANQARALGKETATPAGRFLLQKSVQSYSQAIRDWIELAESKGKRGPRAQALPLMKALDPDLIAAMSAKSILDKVALFSKLLQTAKCITDRLEDEVRFQLYRKTSPKKWKRLQKQWEGHSTWVHRSRAIKGLIKREQVDYHPWESTPALRMGIILIELFRTSTGLIDVLTRKDVYGKALQLVTATPQCLAWLEEAHEKHEMLHPYWMPLTTVPLDWTSMYDGGYRGEEIMRQPVMKVRNPRLLSELDQCDLSRVFSALNSIQHTGWEINEDVLEVMLHFWELGGDTAGLIGRVERPLPEKPYDIKTNEEAKRDWKREAAATYDHNIRSRAGRIAQVKLFTTAKEFIGHTFYMPMSVDFRGRAYVTPSFLQPQGPDTARGLLRFAEPGVIKNNEARKWFLMTGANLWGVKGTIDHRVKWVSDNLSMMLRICDDPIDCQEWVDADDPWQFLAWCLEYGELLQTKGPFKTKIPCHLDGSNNGLQILSILGGDVDGARATNCTPNSTPHDIYQDVADVAMEKLRNLTKFGDDREQEIAQAWLSYLPAEGLPRAATKRPTMTQPYASTYHSAANYIKYWYWEYRDEVGYTPFAAGAYWPCQLLTQVIWSSIAETISGAKRVMGWLQRVTSIAATHDQQIRWVSPSGLPLIHDYRIRNVKRIETCIGEVVYDPTIRISTDRLDPRKARQGVIANFVHACDAAALTEVVNLGTKRGITSWATIHDSFATTADKVGLLSQTIRDAYIKTFETDLLEDFKNQMQVLLPEGTVLPAIPERGEYDVHELRDSLYFFS